MEKEVSRPKIVCLCGSTRFKAAFEEATLAEALAGRIVLSVACFKHSDPVKLSDEDYQALCRLHLKKIDLADEVLFLNVGGYIGKQTSLELAYARTTGKFIRFLEPILP